MTTSLEEARRFLNLARDDLAAFRALVVLPHIRPAIAFFHAQQAIEKSLKAVLFAHGVVFRKTHDLYELADQLNKAGIDLPSSPNELAEINPFAVEFRYGDELIQTLDPVGVDTLATRIINWAATSVAARPS
jgi:HEPN domain-containing protein